MYSVAGLAIRLVALHKAIVVLLPLRYRSDLYQANLSVIPEFIFMSV